MRNTSLDQIIQAKYAFEKKLMKDNIKAEEYQDNNNWFADVEFKNKVDYYNQQISYYEVGAYH